MRISAPIPHTCRTCAHLVYKRDVIQICICGLKGIAVSMRSRSEWKEIARGLVPHLLKEAKEDLAKAKEDLAKAEEDLAEVKRKLAKAKKRKRTNKLENAKLEYAKLVVGNAKYKIRGISESIAVLGEMEEKGVRLYEFLERGWIRPHGEIIGECLRWEQHRTDLGDTEKMPIGFPFDVYRCQDCGAAMLSDRGICQRCMFKRIGMIEKIGDKGQEKTVGGECDG